MKYKVLLNNVTNNNIISDFFQHTENYFTCLTTTDIFQDVITHFEIFKPNIYLVFMESAYDEAVTQLSAIKEHNQFNGAALVVVGKPADCHDLMMSSPDVADLLIRRPISTNNLTLSIISYLEKGHTSVKDENAKKRILIVDDDRTILKMIKTAIGDKYEVTAMINGTLVEKFLNTTEVDLVILDYEMPIMTGAQIYRQMLSNPKTAKIPVCFLTGVAELEKVEEIMALKPRGYLLKPLNMEMLMATIANLA